MSRAVGLIERAKRVEAIGVLVQRATSAAFGRIEVDADEMADDRDYYGPTETNLNAVEGLLLRALARLEAYDPDVQDELKRILTNQQRPRAHGDGQ